MKAEQVIQLLESYKSQDELKKYERFFPLDKRGDDQFIGVRMGQVFELAKSYIDMPIDEIERLLESPVHEVRVAAVSIMDFRARGKKTTAEQKKDLFDLYMRRHDRINCWDLVDRSAPHVIGGYLVDKPRDILYILASSPNIWERRTAIVSTLFFIGRGDKSDTFHIAELLLHDAEEYIQKATGWALRSAGGKELTHFLDQHAGSMPRMALRYAIEKLEKAQRDYYLGMKKHAIS